MPDYRDTLEQIVNDLNRNSSRGQAPDAPPVSGAGELGRLIAAASAAHASDVILTAECAPVFRVHGATRFASSAALSPEDIRHLLLPALSPGQYAALQRDQTVDFAFEAPDAGRCRGNLHYQRGTLAATIRLLPREAPSLSSLHLPESLARLGALRQGLVLLTGPTGCGKTSTLAALIDVVNTTRACHIVTIEEPIEYVHRNRQSVVEQMEVGRDTPGFLPALRSILRQSPDVILIGEMRDPETIATALTASETGHLVFSTLHTNDTAQAVSRILDSFPSGNQPQIRQQLSLALAGIVAQQLAPSADGRTRFPAVEILVGTDAIRHLIRSGNDHQIRSQLTTGRAAGMITMEQSLADLVRTGRITRDSALAHCYRHDEMTSLL